MMVSLWYSLKTVQRPVLWCDIKIRNGTLDPVMPGCWWWRRETSPLAHLGHCHCLACVQETLSRLSCLVGAKLLYLMMMNSTFVMVREILIEDYQRPALIWLHLDEDQKRDSTSHRLSRNSVWRLLVSCSVDDAIRECQRRDETPLKTYQRAALIDIKIRNDTLRSPLLVWRLMMLIKYEFSRLALRLSLA